MRLMILTAVVYSHQRPSFAFRVFHAAFSRHRNFIPRTSFISTSSGTRRTPAYMMELLTEGPRKSARLAKLDSSTAENTSVSKKHGIYSSMKVTELKDLLKRKGLSLSGNKIDLIHRLTTADTEGNTTNTKVKSRLKSTNNKRHKNDHIVTPNTQEDDKINSKKQHVAVAPSDGTCLPRTREIQLHFASDKDLIVIGVDEAGRGPLAGPVVAAAAFVPTNIPGVIDSKKITKEEEREQLYEAIIASPGVRYAVAIVSAQRIDEINILQATLEGMRMATDAVINMACINEKSTVINNVASAERTEISYVITGANDAATSTKQLNKAHYYALIDGNKVPVEMPCPAESMVKGDGREFAIAAASILAKVTRDRLMHEYDKKWPEYELSRHKGYPTAVHMALVKMFGASPIHRKTFAPLKHMTFDEDGKIIG